MIRMKKEFIFYKMNCDDYRNFEKKRIEVGTEPVLHKSYSVEWNCCFELGFVKDVIRVVQYSYRIERF